MLLLCGVVLELLRQHHGAELLYNSLQQHLQHVYEDLLCKTAGAVWVWLQHC
jgi:hypothetical protein